MSGRLYRLLLLLLPRDFRHRFGSEMAAAFDDALVDARARRGLVGFLGVWRLALIDLIETRLATGLRRHAAPRRSPSTRRPKLLDHGGRSGRRVAAGDRRGGTGSPDWNETPDWQQTAASEKPFARRESPVRKEPMDAILQDIRHTARSLRRAPGFTTVAALTLALGIGAVTALFSVVNAVLLEPLPYDDAEELMLLWARNPAQGQDRYFVSPQDFHDWRAQNGSFRQLAGFWPTHYTLTAPEAEAARLRLTMASGHFFGVLGAEPLLGRLHGLDDEAAAAASSVVLSHALWRNRFHGDPGIVGQSLMLNGAPYEVVGVAEPGFEFPEGTELWMNMAWDMATIQSRNARWMSVIGRREPETTLATAQADIDVVTSRLAQQYPASNEGWSATMAPLHEVIVGDARPALLVLMGATALILLIACANVANLQLSRAETRQREVAVRSALGANRSRLARQLITESLILATVGALAGLALAWAALRLLVVIGPANLPRLENVRIDGLVLACAAASTIVTGLVFGLAPVFRLLGADVNETLKEGTRGTAGHEKLKLRNSFVIMEVALAVMLVIGASLLIRSFGNLQAFDPGFNRERVLTLMLDLPRGSYGDDAQVARFYQTLEERLAALPDVQAASVTSTLPLDESVDYYSAFTIEGREPPPLGEQNQAYFRQVGHDFFRTMGVTLLAGRAFSERDREDAPGVVVINETLARQFWPDSDPIGERLTGTQQRFGPLGVMLNDEVEIVGVVDDIRYVGLRESPQPSLYFPYRQAPFRRMTVVVRTSRDPELVIGAVRVAVAEIDPDLPVTRLAAMAQVMEQSVARDRFSMLLLMLFGATALVLANVGIYGVLSYSVAQRSRELGIRMALGAHRGVVRGMVLRQALRLIGVGVAVGLAAAMALSRVLESQLFGVSARDPLTFAGVAVLLATVALAASYLPARRATSVDPIVALRNE
jgi:putative ABC transport system permease protein